MLHEDLDPPPGRSFDLLQEDFEGSVNDFGRSEGLASSMSFLESDGDGADWYEGVRDASESHFSLVPSANLETSPQEAQPGRIASVVASERSRTALPVPALPWERGVFRSIFGDEGVSNPFDSLVLRMPMPLVPAHVPSTSKEFPEPPMPTGDIASRAFKSFKDQHPSEERDMIMDRAICKLQHIVGRTEVIRLSTELARASLSSNAQEEVFSTIAACVGLRSPHTVTKRANAVLSYIRWCDKESIERPFAEESVWAFVSQLRRDKAPPSRSASLISALRFMNFVLGVNISEVLASRRILGLSAQLGVKAKPVSRARPLRVAEVLYMHKILKDVSETPWDRAICAYLLIALYARARHSDLEMVEEACADFDRHRNGFLEIRLRGHKTAQTVAKKNDLLPVIISSKGIVSEDWLGLATDAFTQVGLSLNGPVGAGLFRPFRPGDDKPGKRSLRSSECTTMLKMILERAGSDVTMVTSHSLKRTLIDWGSKFCLDDGILALLGRHSKCVRGSVPVYAREEALKAVRALEPMCQAIADGTFRPDAARALYFAASDPQRSAPGPIDFGGPSTVKVEVIDDSESEHCSRAGDQPSSDSESSSSSSASSESSSASEAPAKAPRHEIGQWAQSDCMANAKTRTLHLLKFVSGGGTLIASCGRSAEAMVRAGPSHMGYSRCRACLRIGKR